MERIFVGLGSNAKDATDRLDQAETAIYRLAGVRLAAKSMTYHTEPQGYKDQPWFFNKVIKVLLEHFWTPQSFLLALLNIEKQLGRVRQADGLRFGPRTIDIDLLLFGEKRISTPCCCVPHPRMLCRAFVLVPLLEIEPEIWIDGISARAALGLLNYHLDGVKIYQ